MKRLQLFIPLGIFVLLGLLLYLGLSRNPDDLPSVLLDKPLPEFSLPALDDPSHVISRSDLLGKPFILNIWASWCPACKDEHPFLNKLSAQGVRIIGVNYKDPPEDAKAVLQKLHNPYALNISDIDGKLGIDLGVYGYPESFIVDAKGIIRYKVIGVITEQIWQSQVAQYFYEN